MSERKKKKRLAVIIIPLYLSLNIILRLHSLHGGPVAQDSESIDTRASPSRSSAFFFDTLARL